MDLGVRGSSKKYSPRDSPEFYPPPGADPGPCMANRLAQFSGLLSDNYWHYCTVFWGNFFFRPASWSCPCGPRTATTSTWRTSETTQGTERPSLQTSTELNMESFIGDIPTYLKHLHVNAASQMQHCWQILSYPGFSNEPSTSFQSLKCWISKNPKDHPVQQFSNSIYISDFSSWWYTVPKT